MKSSLSRYGDLMYLYLDYLNQQQIDSAPQPPETLMEQAVQAFGLPQQRNWIPVVVVKTNPNEYNIIANGWICQAARKAGVERVWCIIAEEADATAAQAFSLGM